MELLERFVKAVEAIAAALTAMSQGGGTLTAGAPDKPATTRRRSTADKKDEKPAEKPADAKPPKDEKVEANPDPKPAPEFDYEILKKAIVELGNFSNGGRAAVLGLLAEYKVKNAKELPVDKREDLHGKVVAKLAELQNEDGDGEFA